MRNKITLLVAFLIACSMSGVFGQKHADSLLDKRSELVKNYEAEKNAYISPSTENLKILNDKQKEIVETDSEIITEVLQPALKEIQNNKDKVNTLEKELKEFKEYEKYAMYVIIGAGVFVLLTIIFFILLIAANSKNKKLRSKLVKMERLQKEHQREIDAIQQELENQKSSFRKELNRIKEEKEKHVKELENQKVMTRQLESKKNELEKQKNELEKQLKEKQAKETSLLAELDQLKAEHQRKLSELEKVGASKEDIERYEKIIAEKDMRMEELRTEKENIAQSLEKYKQKLEEQAKTEKVDSAVLVNLKKENETLLVQLESIKGDYNREKEDNNILREAIERAKQEISKSDNIGEERVRLEEELQKLQRDVEEYKRLLDDERNAFGKYKEETSKERTEKETEYSGTQVDVENELNKYKDLYQKEKIAKEKIVEELKGFIEEVKSFRHR